MNHTDPTPVLELIQAFRRSQTMFTAVSLGIFDKLETGGKSADAQDSACWKSATVCMRTPQWRTST